MSLRLCVSTFCTVPVFLFTSTWSTGCDSLSCSCGTARGPAPNSNKTDRIAVAAFTGPVFSLPELAMRPEEPWILGRQLLDEGADQRTLRDGIRTVARCRIREGT